VSTTGAPVSLALNTLAQVPNPSNYQVPFAQVQLQNSSVFVIEVTAGGLQYTIQPFTSTVPLTADGNPITILPTQNPGGATGTGSTLTPVWLAAGEAPPMEDGPLTAAAIESAISSVGLGSTLYPATSLAFSGGIAFANVPVPAGTRTLIIDVSVGNTSTITNVQVSGSTSGRNYYNQPPYLASTAGPNNLYTIIVPFIGLVDTSVVVTLTEGGTVQNATLTVFGDTAAYPESIFYNGTAQTTGVVQGVIGNTTIVTGPKRILAVTADANAAGVGSVQMNGNTLIALNAGQGPTSLPMPPFTILQALETIVLAASTAATAGSVCWAYP
jgi:hypothetical protein